MLKKLSSALTAVLVASLVLAACGNVRQEQPEIKNEDIMRDTVTETEEAAPMSIDEMLESMTLREKLGQLFIIRPDALMFEQSQEEVDNPNVSGVQYLGPELEKNLRDYPVGGIIMFGKNILTPTQISLFNSQLQQASKIPLFIVTDEEGGIVSRIAGNPNFDVPRFISAADVGKNKDPRDAYNMGEAIGKYLAEFGFNMDFAPVADVHNNSLNTVIGDRSFSYDAETVADMAEAMAKGLRAEGIIPVFKHFPGHGNTMEDSHSSIASTGRSKAGLEQCEWIPFMRAGAEDCIMSGHIAAPNITGTLIPSTMSELMIRDILKGELGFEGLVITDSMVMKAVTNSYSPIEAVITAINAGCDIILMPYDFRDTFDELVAAVEEGTVSEEYIDEIVYRILSFKKAHNILK